MAETCETAPHFALQLRIGQALPMDVQQVEVRARQAPSGAGTITIHLAALRGGVPALEDVEDIFRQLIVVFDPGSLDQPTLTGCWVLLKLALKVVLADNFTDLFICLDRVSLRMQGLSGFAHVRSGSRWARGSP